MIEQLAFLDEPLRLEFEAKIVHKTRVGDGQVEVILEKTYFYPTGGGQTHDTGTLGEAQILDVFKDERGNVVHRLSHDIAGSTVLGKIDADRRLGNMQHHSAQHILSGSVEALLGLETLSARISSMTPSTIDVPLVELSQADLERVEQFANALIVENRSIKSYFITDEQIQTIPFRRPPKVRGQIRVVEVDSFDYSACGGTHCPQTGMIGLIKILKSDIKNKKLRLHFAAGRQALRAFQTYHQIVTGLSRQLSTSPEEVQALISHQTDQLRLAQSEIKRLQTELLSLEAQQLVVEAETFEAYRLILATFNDRPLNELRELAKLARQTDDIIAMLAGYDGRKLSLVVSCAANTGLSAKALLARQLLPIEGKGGGDDQIAQGGGQATKEDVEAFFEKTRDYILIN